MPTKKRGAFLMALLLLAMPPAHAAELVVLSAAAAQAAVDQVPAQFLAATGKHVRFVFGTAGQIHDRIVAAAPFDLVIVTPGLLADLVQRKLVAPESRADLGVVKLGVAVRSGQPAPPLESDAVFKQTLLDAPSIGLADPHTGATTGIYLAQLMARLGLAETIRSKVKYYADGQTAMRALARGEVSLALGQVSEIMPVPGVTLAGLVPDHLQLKTVYAVGIARQSTAPALAQELRSLLTGPTGRAAFKANGFDTGS